MIRMAHYPRGLLYPLLVLLMQHCPCCSGKSFSSCCEPILSAKSPALTAEALMRSRYTAYAVKAIDYLLASTHYAYRDRVDTASLETWAEKAQWLGLNILKTEQGKEGDLEGTVEFIATYQENDQTLQHHELGFFKKVKGAWYYYKGKMVKPEDASKKASKTGRNDPCPCGSSKKFKKCCGQNA